MRCFGVMETGATGGVSIIAMPMMVMIVNRRK